MEMYLFKSAACMGVFLLFYKLLLEKENMHFFKRYYLLITLAVSLVIPSIVFTEYVEIIPDNVDTQAPIAHLTVETRQTDHTVGTSTINWHLLSWTVYGLGALGFGIRFVRNLVIIWARIRRNPQCKNGFITTVLLQEQLAPHTFLRYIFLNKQKFESDSIPKAVLDHEETHAKQKHSLDVLFIELMQVILWFNPIIYFYKKCIKLNHEFLADSSVLKKNENQLNYQNTLLAYLSNDHFNTHTSPGIANAINYSSIKKRFKIMKKQTSRKGIIIRSILLLPLLATLLISFSETRTIYQKGTSGNSQVKSDLGLNQEIEKYNTLAKKYNAIPIEKRTIPLKDLKILETIYRGMNTTQKEAAQPFPQCLPKTNQEDIIKEIIVNINDHGRLLVQGDLVELKDLEKYLSKINSHLTIDEKNKMVKSTIEVDPDTPTDVIKKVEQNLIESGVATIDIVKYNYTLKNTIKTANSAQLSQYNELAKKYNDMIRENRNIKILKTDVDRLTYIYGIMSEKQKASAQPFPNFPEPPPVPKTPNAPSNYEYDKIEIDKTIEKQEVIFIEKKLNTPPPPHAPTFIEEEDEEIHETLDKHEVIIVHKGDNSNDSPAALSPPSPVDFIMDAAKKGAIFYYQDKEVSSDKAIDIIRKNKNLNVDARNINGDLEIRITKDPVTIE